MVHLLGTLTLRQKTAIMLAVDLVMVVLALGAATVLSENIGGPDLVSGRIVAMVPLLLIAAAALAFLLGIPRIRLKTYEIRAAARSALFAGLLGIASAALAAQGGLDLPPAFHVIFAVLFLMLSTASRVVMLQMLLWVYRRQGPVARVAIYGAGRTGMQLAAALRAHPLAVPVAFVDDNSALHGKTVAGLTVWSGVHLPQLIAEEKIERVFVAIPSLTPQKRAQIARRVGQCGATVQSLPSYGQLIGHEALVDRFGGLAGPGRDMPGAGRTEYAGRSVLISGAGGSIGSELSRQVLACAPRRIVLFEQSEFALYNIERELRTLADDTVEIVPVLGSVGDEALVRRVLAGQAVEIVLHAAAYKHVPMVEMNPIAGLANNVFGTFVLAQQAREAGVLRFVLVSSDKAVRPANVMGASKRLAELLIQDLATRSEQTVFSIVRFGNVLGSSGSVVPLFQEQIANGGPVTLTDENVTRFFMTVQEAAQLVLLAGSFAEGGEVFVLDMGAPVPVRRIARRMIEAAGYTVRDADNPDGDIEIVTTGLRPGEKLHEELMIGSGDQVTQHQKIFRVREAHLSEIEVAAALRALKEAVTANDTEAARAVLGRWIRDEADEGRDLLARIHG